MHSFRRALLRQTTRTLVRTVPSKHVAKGVATFLNAASPSTTVASRAIVSSMLRSYSSVASIDVPVPSMGDSISEGTVVEWLKQPGDMVATDDVIVVLETDKVSVDVRAPCSGRLLKQLASIDDNVLVGAPLFQLEQGAEGSDVPSTPPSPAAASPSSSSSSSSSTSSSNATPEIVNVPSMGDSISEGTIVSWLKSVGDSVAADDVVLIIETDKVSVDVRAPKAGTIQEILASVDDVVAIGAPLFKFVPGEHIPTPSSSTPSIPAAAPTPSQAKTPSTPPPPPPAPSSTPSSSTQPLFFSPERTITREKMSRMRLRTAERLKESQNTSASLTTFQEVDMTNLLNLRKTYKEAFEEKHGVKLGFMSAFVKASSAALLEVPGINAMIDNEHQEIVYRDYVDMSVAVSTPKGLVTPVLQNTESMSFAEVEKKLVELAEKARHGKLTLEEMTGGNFTISNGGVFGSLMGTPIINLPQSGILGMHATKMRPMVVDGVVVPRPMMYLALTYDHRIVDGREATTCLKSIADKIAHPERLLLDL